jgi:hypothetical protein
MECNVEPCQILPESCRYCFSLEARCVILLFYHSVLAVYAHARLCAFALETAKWTSCNRRAKPDFRAHRHVKFLASHVETMSSFQPTCLFTRGLPTMMAKSMEARTFVGK